MRLSAEVVNFSGAHRFPHVIDEEASPNRRTATACGPLPRADPGKCHREPAGVKR